MKWNWTKFCDKIEGNVRLPKTRHSGWITLSPLKETDQENSFVFFRALPESPNRQADTSYHIKIVEYTSNLTLKMRIKRDRKKDRLPARESEDKT